MLLEISMIGNPTAVTYKVCEFWSQNKITLVE